MPSLRWTSSVALVVITAASCSLVSTDGLQEGTSVTGTSATTSTASTGAGPSVTSSASGSSSGGGGETGNGGHGGDASGGGGTADATATTAASTGQGGGGGHPPGPCDEPSTYADLVLALDPIAYFRMGPDAASLAVDSAASPNDAGQKGLLESVASPLGELGGCAMHATTLKGAPALLAWTPPDPKLFGEDGVFSLEMWFVVDELPPEGDARFLFAREYLDGNRFHLYVSGGGALYWFFDADGWRQIGFDDADIVPGALHHVVAVRAGAPGSSEGDIHFYYDGRLKTGASGTPDGTLDDEDIEPLTMPGEAYSDPADGTFDEIAIYDRVLTQDEVRSHFCAIVDDVAICP